MMMMMMVYYNGDACYLCHHMVTTSIDTQLHQRYIINENYGKQGIYLFEEE